MLSIENGTLLNFDRLLSDNIPGPAETCIIDPNVPQARGCLSTCNVRLSFGELDQGQNSRPVEQPRTASDGLRLPHLGKYDKLMLKELYCHESLESSSRMVGNVTEDESRTVFGRGTHGGLPGVPAPTEQFKIRSCPAVGAFLSGDEFVIIRDNFLLRGRGIEGKYRVVEEIHRKEKPIIDSVWCTFRHQERHVRPEHATVTPVLEAFEPLDALCIAEQRKIHVHSVNGEQYSHASSFPIRKLWSFPLGLLVERDTRVVSNLTSVLGYPNLFTATTHLEELAPVLFLGSTQSPEKTAILIHPDSVVAGVSDELPLVLFFEPHGNVHSLWLARLTTAEEMEAAVELIGKDPVDGETLHFHGNCESPRLRSRTKSAPMFTAGSSIDSFRVSPGMAPIRALMLNDSTRKNPSLHREVLLATGRKFPLAESSSTPALDSGNFFPGKFISPLPPIQFSETPEASRSSSRPQATSDSRSASSSALVSMDMSASMNFSKQSSLSLLTYSKAGKSNQGSPNAPAHTLRDIRSPAMSFSQSKINSIQLDSRTGKEAFSSLDFRRTRSGSVTQQSQRHLKKLTRVTHPCSSTQPITDELAFPKLTFVHIWSDAASPSRHKPSRDSFQLVDYFRRIYFCFVLSGQQVLRCVRLRHETLEDGHQARISAESVTSLPAVSAVKLSGRNLMVVLEPSYELKVYASPTLPLLCVDLNFRSLDHIVNSVQTGAYWHGEGPTASSPHLSKKGGLQPIFSPHFSPVPENVSNSPALASSVATKMQTLTPCSGNKFLVESAGQSRLLRIPDRLSSDVIELCLDALRMHIDTELFSRIFAELSKLAFDSKRRNITLQDRWNTFFTAVLAKLACPVAAVGQQVDSNPIHTAGSPWKAMLDRIHSSRANAFRIVVDRNVPYFVYSPAVLLTLHLVCEETLLFGVWNDERICMLPWMRALAEICELSSWMSYYDQQIKSLPGQTMLSISIVVNGPKRPAARGRRLPVDPPCLITSLEDTLRGGSPKFPVAQCVNPLSRRIVRLVAALPGLNLRKIGEEDRLKTLITILRGENFTVEDHLFLPKPLQIGLQAAFFALCQSCSFEKLPSLVFEIAEREDAVKCKSIIEGQCAGDFCVVDFHRKTLPASPEGNDPDARKKAPPLPRSLITKRFANDARVREAERLLVTSEAVVIPLNAMHSANEVEFRKSQEAWLKSVATRTMSLPVARGMLSLGSEYAYATEKLTAPEMVYSGLERGNGRNVSLKTDDLPSGYENWPRFHNGVATGLRLRHYRHDSVKFDHHWLAFNAGQQTKRESVDYAGIFLGMALNGLIDSNTDPVELHNLLIRLEDPVSIAVILGMACVKRGSQDKRYYRMISLHIISFIPDSGIELVIPQNIHVASLLSLGLLYRGSADRFISERLLAEIWSGSTADINGEATAKEGTNAERESTSLAAAIGLGFVLLGLGNQSVLGLADLAIPQRLRTLMTGGLHGKSNAPNKRMEGVPNGLSPPRSRDMDEQSINTHITAPGAILALAMIFMKTERNDVAEWMAMPGTLQELDEIRPDFLLLRVVARSLIMWTTVEATEKWVNGNFPAWILKNVFLTTTDMEMGGQDVVSLTQAYFYILAGSCMSLGLKFAGTASVTAKNFLLKIITVVTKWCEDTSVIRRCSQSLMQTCLTSILIAVASVMAGTGDLDVFRVLRYMHGRPRGSITYGLQMGVHMAIGLLFLGCGLFTLGTSNEALAAMLVAFFPMWPKNANDNRYHLQAFRHLYVLAVENRLVTTRSIYDGSPVQTMVRVVFSHSEKEEVFTTPCVLPELTKLKRISIASGRHWLIFTGDDAWLSLKKLLSEEGVVVYPPSGSFRKDLTLANPSCDNLMAHFDRFMSHPADSQAEVLLSMKKFLREYPLLCPDRGIVGLFEIASRSWFGRRENEPWLAWVIYQCAVHQQLDALLEILAFSFEIGEHWKNLIPLMLRTQSDSRSTWKIRLRKENFQKNFADDLSKDSNSRSSLNY